METIDIQEIKQKTTKNVLFLFVRNIGIQAISTIGFFILTILMGTGEVGLFGIVVESVSILGYFSDVGLASALIQQKEKISKIELRTTFLIQQLLVLLCLLVVAIIYPQIASTKGYGPKETWILLSLCFAFVAASLKTIPSVQLERNLNFKTISTIDVIENTSFYLIAVIFALQNYGAYSYAIATFIRSLLGLIIIYLKSPWPIGYAFSSKSARKLFRFGIPFQINSLIAVAKDRLSNLLVAGIIGRESFGLLSWAQKGPRIPLNFMDAIMKVTFPTFARLQDDKEILKKSIERSLYFIALIVFPMLTGISFLAPDLMLAIPKYTKWSPALIPLYLYAINGGIAAITSPLTNAFNAVGKITTTTKFMIMWTVLTWILYPSLSFKYGYVGTSIAMLLVSLSSFIVWYVASKTFSLSIIKTIRIPFIGSLFMASILLMIHLLDLNIYIKLSAKLFFGIASYTIFLLFFSQKEIKWFITQLQWLRNKN